MKPYQHRYVCGIEALNRQYAIDEAAAKAKELERKLKDGGERRDRPNDSKQEATELDQERDKTPSQHVRSIPNNQSIGEWV
jgi:hypothetical protein